MTNKNIVLVNADDDIWFERNGYVDVGAWQAFFKSPLEAVLKKLDRKGEHTISVLLSNNEHIKALNEKHRNINKSTDVLSFPQYSRNELKVLKDVLLGDIVLSYNVINDAVSSVSGNFFDAVTHLFVHGVLHNFGFDHETEEEEIEMLSLEADILKDLGITQSYYDGGDR
jgi:probable rRNA maturation factor